MKQTIFLAVLTAVGAIGAFVVEPFVGVAVYFFFAVLRPQYLWKWALQGDVSWSAIVAWPTIAATVWFLLTSPPAETSGEPRRRFSGAHKAYLAFGAWICMAYVASQNRDVSWDVFVDYQKIFVMFVVGAIAIRTLRQVWWIYVLSTGALIYIAYELNYVYFTEGRLDVYRNGYGGLDNNGAGLMLAMAIPLAIHGWEAAKTKWRWLFLAGVPLLIHAVLMSYSRGAMLALVVVAPLIILRSRRKRQSILVFVLLLACVPFLAGKEIRQEFFSIEKYDSDTTVNERFDSWKAAFRIANRYPIFGVGIRNSPLMTWKYGADTIGRVIHSQYFQLMADTGYPGLALYLTALGSLFVAMHRARRTLKKSNLPDAKMAQSMVNGLEGATLVFCVGVSFLSMEVFELPYVLAILGAQIALLVRNQVAETATASNAAVPSSLPLPAYRAS